jgi:putative copper resistance protein D
VLEALVIGLRWLQFGGAIVLLGVPLFLLQGVRNDDCPDIGWSRPLLIAGAAVVGIASMIALVAQTAVMAGSLSEAVKPETLTMMVTGTSLGLGITIRAGLALMALLLVSTLGTGRVLWWLTTATGFLVIASFAWTGHGTTTEGEGRLLHLAADIVHLVAAAVWLGALVALTLLLVRRIPAEDRAIHRALRGFSGAGTVAVLLLVLSGLVNTGFLVGPSRIATLGTGLYGQLLIAKLALFALMLALAAGNRFRQTPGLGSLLGAGEDPARVVARLRRDVSVEALAGALLLGIVAWMGTLAPPSSL